MLGVGEAATGLVDQHVVALLDQPKSSHGAAEPRPHHHHVVVEPPVGGGVRAAGPRGGRPGGISGSRVGGAHGNLSRRRTDAAAPSSRVRTAGGAPTTHAVTGVRWVITVRVRVTSCSPSTP